MRRALIGSGLLNGVLLAGLGWMVKRFGVRAALGRVFAPRTDFAARARSRFLDPSDGAVILLGDSQLEWAPVPDLYGLPVRNRALSGARTTDVAAWLDGVLAERPARIVLMIGTNDAWFGCPVAESEAAVRTVLQRVAAEVGCPVTIVSVPPLVGHDDAVRAINAALARLAAEFGHRWVDVGAVLGGLEWTDDRLHLNARAYHAIAPLLREDVPHAL